MTELEAEHLLPRHCWGCWVEQPQSAFSKTQWNKEHSNPVASRTCMKCITAKQEAARTKSYKTMPRDLRCTTNRITDASNTITNKVLISWPEMFPIFLPISKKKFFCKPSSCQEYALQAQRNCANLI